MKFRRSLSFLLVETALVLSSIPLLMFPTLRPAATLILLLLSIVWWIVRWRLDGELLPPTPFNGALLLWGIAVGVGIGVTAFPEETLPKATGLILGLIVFRYVTVHVETRRQFTWAVLAFVGFGLAIALLGMLGANWHFKIPLLRQVLDRLPPQLVHLPEAPGGGVNPNQLGGALTLYVPFALAVVCGWRAGRDARLWLILRLLLLGGFAGLWVLSQSRSAWIGGAVGCWGVLVVSGLLEEQRRLRVAALVFLAAPLFVLGALWIRGVPEQLPALWQESGGLQSEVVGQISLSGRVEIWSRALYAIQDFPFTGCGLGTFREVVWILYPLFTIPPTTDIAHAHNIFLQVAVDVGIPGLLAYVALLGVAGVVGWRTARQDARLRPLALGLLGGLLALHVYGLTDALAPGSKPALAFWLALGLLAVAARLAAAPSSSEAGERSIS